MASLSEFLRRTSVEPIRYLPNVHTPSNRLSLLEVLKKLTSLNVEPRQPHDCLNELVTESHIARTIFDRQILPLLTDFLSARRPVLGPEKNPGRVEDKVASKLKIAPAQLDSYKASGEIHFGMNCDFSRSMQPVGTMNFIQRASDAFQGRGMLTLSRNDGSSPIQIYILDVENGFIKEVSHKPNLMRINLKLAVPIILKNGTETFHVLEHKILLKASLQNEKDGCAAWAEYRELEKLEGHLEAAFNRASQDSPESNDLLTKWVQVTERAAESAQRRAVINARDFQIAGITSLVGYKPDTEKSGVVRRDLSDISWAFIPLDEVISQMSTQLANKLPNQAAMGSRRRDYA